MGNVLFVCTGNTCRSPMAEGIFNVLAERIGIETRAISCGLAAVNGQEVTGNAVTAAGELGADISGHRARQITQELLEQAAAVYTMTGSQADILRGILPQTAEKIFTIGQRDVSDPYGGDVALYRKTAGELFSCVEKIVSGLK